MYAMNRRNRVKRAGAIGCFTAEEFLVVLKRQRYRCVYCRGHGWTQFGNF